MDRGGVETWLMHVIRNIDRNWFQFHFAVQTEAQSAYDEEIISLGGKIHCLGNPRRPLRYGLRFRDISRTDGPFHVVHSHVYLYSGFVLNLAYRLGIPVRIAQSHTARPEQSRTLTRFVYERTMRKWIMRYATHRIAISRRAGEALFRGPFILSPYGIDFKPFKETERVVDGNALKERYHIPTTRKVVGHVGRFVPEKNHHFLIETFQGMVNSGVDAHLLLVGSGQLLAEIQKRVNVLGLSNRCTFAGLQSDVVPFLRIMDVLVLPSRWEGLGIVALEAQAAGVPVLASANVPGDVDVIPELVEHLCLERGSAFWAYVLRHKLEQGPRKRGDEVLRLERSQFGLRPALDSLSRIYTTSTHEPVGFDTVNPSIRPNQYQ